MNTRKLLYVLNIQDETFELIIAIYPFRYIVSLASSLAATA